MRQIESQNLMEYILFHAFASGVAARFYVLQ